MAPRMSRKDKLVYQLILLLAVGTFLFGIWALVGGLKSPAARPTAGETNRVAPPPTNASPPPAPGRI
jgi:hypothetical protein